MAVDIDDDVGGSECADARVTIAARLGEHGVGEADEQTLLTATAEVSGNARTSSARKNPG